MKRLIFALLFVLSFSPLCFAENDGHFWNKMSEAEKYSYMRGYIQSSSDSIAILQRISHLTANAVNNEINNLTKNYKKKDEPRVEWLNALNEFYKENIALINKSFVKLTFINKADLEVMVKELDAYYSRKKLLGVTISEAIVSIKERSRQLNLQGEKKSNSK